jgi:hypothetical protein
VYDVHGDLEPAEEPPPQSSSGEPPPALRGPRAELLALNHQIAEASEALARCNQPVARLQQLISDCDARSG